MDEIFERVRTMLAEQLEIDEDRITMDSNIMEDFDADSLDVVDMVMSLEDEFGIEVPDEEVEALWKSMDNYERNLWNEGCTLEMIKWYHEKRKGYQSHHRMMAEFPTNAIEAFSTTSSFLVLQLDSVFSNIRSIVKL